MSIKPDARQFINDALFRAEKARLRVREVALVDATRCSRTAVYFYAIGERPAPPEVIAALERVLQLQPGQLTAGVDQKAAKTRAMQMVLKRQRRLADGTAAALSEIST